MGDGVSDNDAIEFTMRWRPEVYRQGDPGWKDMTMTLDLDKLEQLAKAATPGPWKVAQVDKDTMVMPADERRGYILAARRGPMGEQYVHGEQSDLEHVAAADPSTVLALIARIRELEAGLRMACVIGIPHAEERCDEKDEQKLRALLLQHLGERF